MTVSMAIIGGTGVYDPNILSNIRDETITTPFGETAVKIGEYQGREVAFMNRHGAGHSVPPHLVNYRANIAGLKKLGVKTILATAAVGSINEKMKPGDFVFCDQFLDFTKSRAQTFFNGGEHGVVHVDVTDPYCPDLRKIMAKVADELNLSYHQGGVYVTTEGPRYESPAEIKMFKMLGGDLVGMTSVPEVILAREAGICYATVCMVTNFGAGISENPLTHEEVLEVMNKNAENLRKLAMGTISALDPDRECYCHTAVEGPMHELLKG
ncbi:5'-methylthioadenosine phosphorylase [Desulfohalotomaculum tongense]|uniref:S-methyl-5'-thioadenosine phosphorylase n=1 Tax=Desulforadius tongensis TaxID=1216062 RepID=UPI00195E680C|nr:S-methyl-5'-thioadenosine phosphorylase [Desulforadius tongensis]MBM7854385.1 5'-methylthioadenosine phosphorylase [Desulforadius tongensis]